MKQRRFVRTFKPQFAPKVEAGTKRQTVRKKPVRMPKTGDLISCREWTGKPYHSKQRILRESTITKVDEINIFVNGVIQINSYFLGPLNAEKFARADGFTDLDEMLAWFKQTHRIGTFNGIVIHWD